MSGLANDVSRAEALLRAADALLQALGTGEVILVLPVPGSTPPAAEQVSLSPAVVRSIGSSAAPRTRLEVLLSASTVDAQAGSRNCDPPDSLLKAALGVLREEKLWRIESVECDSFGGMPYLYRVLVTD